MKWLLLPHNLIPNNIVILLNLFSYENTGLPAVYLVVLPIIIFPQVPIV